MSPLLLGSGEKCPQRIVSVTLASDEILLDILDDRKRLAAVTYLADDESISNVVDKARGIKKIHANLEQIVELTPDLVVTADYLGSDFIQLLRAAGLNTIVLNEVKDIDSITDNIELLGEAVCEEEDAREIIKKMKNGIADINSRHNPGSSRPEVLFYSAPGFTAGPNSIIDQLITIAGGENAFQSESFIRSSRISLEYIVETDPDMIIVSNFSPSEPDFEKKFIENSAIKQTTAFKEGNIHVIEGRHIVSASHYIVRGIEELADIIDGAS